MLTSIHLFSWFLHTYSRHADESQSPMEDDSSLESMSDKEDSESKDDGEEKSDIDMDDIELDAKIEEARKALQVSFFHNPSKTFLVLHAND